MAWVDAALKASRARFGDACFTTHELVDFLSTERGYSRGTTDRLIHELVKTGDPIRLGRGVYRFRRKYEVHLKENLGVCDGVTIEAPIASLQTAREALSHLGIPFVITGPSLLSVYVHHLPRRQIHLVYVTRGAGDSVGDELKRRGLTCLVAPSKGEIELALELFPDKDIFVARETMNLNGGRDGLAGLERALVDTYFETTRQRIPFPPEEFGRMISKIASSVPIDVSHALMLAGRRGVKKELRTVLEHLLPGLRLHGQHTMNGRVGRVIAGISSERR